MFMLSILFGTCLILGTLCLIYYGIITVYAGFGTAFAWFWICAGLGFLILGFIMNYMIKNGIKLPAFLRFLFITVISAGICIFLLLEGTIFYYSTRKAEPGADYLVVLGAQVRGTRITKSLQKRLDAAVNYLKGNLRTVAIVSGGRGPGEDITEAEAMKKYLMNKGIDERRIIKEDKSANTDENIRFSLQLMKGDNPKVAIVTNGFHIFRALSIAKKQGLTRTEGLAASSDSILAVNYYVREAVGILKDFLVGNL
jgi:uncharacterized SAM-binding protein YcdF (DUF218 family)